MAAGNVQHQLAFWIERPWDTTFATHLDATFLLFKAVAASMVTRGRGKIINIVSVYAHFGAAMLPSYGAAKAGVVQLTKAMAVELAPHHIQVNAIAPGWIATEMNAAARANPDFAEFIKTMLARTPAARWGEPDDLSGAAVFLASSAADFITGVVLRSMAGIRSADSKGQSGRQYTRAARSSAVH